MKRSATCCRRPKGPQLKGNSRRRCYVFRLLPNSVIAPARRGCTSSKSIVEGPRAGLAARFATALRDDDAAELSAVSEEFERIGDLVAAVDSAAQAALDVSSPRSPGIGVGILGTCRGPGRKMRRSQYPGASSGQRAIAAYRSRSRDRHVDR